MIALRDYQTAMKRDVADAWADGYQNLCGVLPTGAGKTILFGAILAEYDGVSLVAAHRQELIGQISNALARMKVVHSIISPPKTVEWILKMHTQRYGRPFYDPQARCTVASVDTLLARRNKPYIRNLFNRVSLWVMDECHHILRKNKWGKIVSFLSHAKGLGVTATPTRADRKGLGREADGVIDKIVSGPSMRDLINQGYLTDYRIICPPSDVDRTLLKQSKTTGDYTQKSVTTAVRRSSIMGDVIEHYLKWAYGKLGVTFVPDVQTAHEIAEMFNTAGVPAEAVHAGTPDLQRQSAIDRFENGVLKQLVNVDLFGEGFDLPALEVVSMARHTASFNVYSQQFGRALRPMRGKHTAIIIDHAGNILNPALGGPPDSPRFWSLDRPPRRKQDPQIKIKVCPKCTSAYSSINRICPYCGYKPVPAQRSAPKFVDGDLIELDPAVLARMRGDAERIVWHESEAAMLLERVGASPMAVLGAKKNHNRRRLAQLELREAIAIWATIQRQQGKHDSESYRRFYHTWGVDVLSAQMLGYRQSIELTEKIRNELQ
jgi:superfamily II DNA or RNA helicase